ncbi:phage tail assembly chaperone [Paenibacillus ginsengarvi]|uniref:Uncharacterized protein n=1 Tax=Paenibacillus ginsengarvi TaxID=400777 RepID=A0A3B0BQD5_9BACL|nr:hypothetical protein [Paenibacillus ginsengarvi]RKN75000.1 hypothetical protein D7M11_26040 [Paenibacillus ginsengarvi]
MQPKIKHQDVEINGRKFRVKKFDAMTGSFMLFKVTGLLAPLFGGVDLTKLTDEASAASFLKTVNISSMLSGLGELSEKDFSYVQEKCLQVCEELLPAGPAQVLNKQGAFGVMDLEDDTITVLALTAHTLIFNLKGFFQGSPLASFLGGLKGTSLQS